MNQVNNILHFYRLAGKFYGVNWYASAYQFAVELAGQFDKPIYQTAGIISALSPLKSWQENKRLAILFYETGIIKHTNLIKGKIYSIEKAKNINEIIKILNGRKIRSFYQNILGFKNVLTIDRHAANIAHKKFDSKRRLTDKQYTEIENNYFKASRILNINPVLLQSITWQYFRTVKDQY